MASRPRPRTKTAFVAAALISCALLLFAPIFPQTNAASVTVEPPERAAEINLLGEDVTPDSNAPEPSQTEEVSASAPASRDRDAMKLTVPKLGLRDVPVPSGSTQKRLDREGIMRLSESGVPWREGSNTFIAGHTLGYDDTKVPYAFYDLDRMRPGDEILVRDSNGKRYRFRVFDRMVVRPTDFWVTYPDSGGRTILSLQACVPVPTFEDRLIVRAELLP